MFLRETTINWYASNTVFRTDYLKVLKFTNVSYMEQNWGFGSHEMTETVVSTYEPNYRIMPYKN